jgi:hypothetical protein
MASPRDDDLKRVLDRDLERQGDIDTTPASACRIISGSLLGTSGALLQSSSMN